MKEQDFVAGQDFLLAVKKHWTTQMYQVLFLKKKLDDFHFVG